MIVPIVARRDPGGEALSRRSSAWPWTAKEHDPAAGRQCRPRGQFAKILVECQKNPAFARYRGQHIGVGGTRCDKPHPRDIVTGCFKRRRGSARKILVR
jgi:hypothetical protein